MDEAYEELDWYKAMPYEEKLVIQKFRAKQNAQGNMDPLTFEEVKNKTIPGLIKYKNSIKVLPGNPWSGSHYRSDPETEARMKKDEINGYINVLEEFGDEGDSLEEAFHKKRIAERVAKKKKENDALEELLEQFPEEDGMNSFVDQARNNLNLNGSQQSSPRIPNTYRCITDKVQDLCSLTIARYPEKNLF